MIKDRLPELQRIQKAIEENERFGSRIFRSTRRMTYSRKWSDDFFKKREEIAAKIDLILSKVEEVKRIHSDILSSPQADNKIKQRLEMLSDEIRALIQTVRLNLDNVERETEALNDKNSAEYRIRKLQHLTLTEEFFNTIFEYNTTQVDYRERCKGRIKRQLEITGKVTTDEEVENMLEDGNSAIFTSEIRSDTLQARQMMDDIKARHEDIMNLEKSIRELFELFTDLAFLVEQQGEMVNRIENHVANAKDYVARGKKQYKRAERYQRKSQKKKLCLGAFGISALGIVILIVIIG